MTTDNFKNGDLVIVELTEWISDGFSGKKPLKVVKEVEYTIIEDRRGRKYISDKDNGKVLLKNFKKGELVKGSFGMTRYKSTWLNYGFKVLGGLEWKRNKILESILENN